MANLMQIKRSLNNATVPNLANGELAYTANGDVLYIGHPDGSSANIRIGGEQTPGVLTANQALVANSTGKIDSLDTASLTVSGYAVTSVIDVDGFDSGVSNTALATSESIKAYVDSVAGAGVSNLNDVSDVNVATPAEGAFLVYDATEAKWVDATLTAGNALSGSYANGTDTYTLAVVDSDIRGLFSAAGDLSYNSSTGEFSFTNDAGDIESVVAGSGLTGGGTAGDVTLNVGAGDGITVAADDISVTGANGISVTAAGVNVDDSGDTSLVANSTGLHIIDSTLSITESQISDLGTYLTTVALNDVSDVTITAAATGEFLRYNGSAWVDSTIQNGDITSGMITQHEGDLSITASQISDDVTLGTDTTGNYVATVTGGNGIESTGATTGETIAHSLSVTAANGISVTAGGVNVDDSGDTSLVANTTGLHVIDSTLSIATSQLTGDYVSDITGTANEIEVDTSTGSVTIGLPDDVTISGNLTVSGTTTTIDTTQLLVEDNMIGLASSSANTTTDFGVYGQYNDGAEKYSGFIRDASDSGTWKLLDGLTVEPTGMAYDATGQSLAALDVGALDAASLTLTTALAVPQGGTGVTSFTDNGIIYGDGSNALDVTAAGTEGQVLQAGSGGVPEFGTLDGGTF